MVQILLALRLDSVAEIICTKKVHQRNIYFLLECTKRALWLRLRPYTYAYAACLAYHRHNVPPVDLRPPPSCGMSWPVHVQSCFVSSVPAFGHRLVSRFAAIARAGQTAHRSTTQKSLPTSFGIPRTGYWQGSTSRLSSDRPMPFKRSSLLWLAGGFVISAVVTQGAHGKVITVAHGAGHINHQQVCPDLLAHSAGLANSRSVLVTGIEQSDSNAINWQNTNKEPCQHHFILS